MARLQGVAPGRLQVRLLAQRLVQSPVRGSVPCLVPQVAPQLDVLLGHRAEHFLDPLQDLLSQ